MRRLLLSILVLSPLGLGLGCGDDTVAPGDINVHWSHGPTASCDSRHVVTLEARAVKGEDLVGSAQASCESASKDGTITIYDLTPGNYTIEVEAFDASGKGLYLGTAERQPVSEGKLTDSDTITLTQKPVRLAVDWTVPSGKCAGSPIKQVHIQYIPDQSQTGAVVAEETVGCDAVYEDLDGESQPGVLFVDLDPDDDIKLFLFGLDANGNEVATGEEGPFALSPGDNERKVVPLTICPGDPPSCD